MTGYPPAAAPDDWPPPVRAALMNPGPMPIADVLTVAAHLGWGDMARLRDEVERLRDKYERMGGDEQHALAEVLDLIDKQREGQ